MAATRILLATLPAGLMIACAIGMAGIEQWLAGFGQSDSAQMMLGRAGLALPYVTAGVVGLIFLFAAAGAANIKAAGWSVAAGSLAIFLVAGARELARLSGLADRVPAGQSVFGYLDAATLTGASATLLAGMFALRVGLRGNAAFSAPAPRRMRGKRAVHGDADWMKMQEAAKLFPDTGGIVIGERYRVDRDSVAASAFRADVRDTW